MKKLMLMWALALPLGQVAGQPKDTVNKEVEVEIDGNKVTIEASDLEELSEVDLNSILREVTKRTRTIQMQHRELMAQVDRQLAAGEITEEQADDMREMISSRTEESMEVVGQMMDAWGEQYESRMDAWEQEYESKMEAWEDEVELRAEKGDFTMPPFPPIPPIPGPDVGEAPEAPESPESPEVNKEKSVVIDQDGIRISESENGENSVSLRFEEEEIEKEEEKDDDNHDATDNYFDMHFGFNQMLRNGETLIESGDEQLNFWGSNVFELGFGGKTRIGKPKSVLFVKYGLELSWQTFRLMDNNALIKTDTNVLIMEHPARNLDKSKYKIAYFNAPVMLQLDFSEPGDRDESFTLGVGGYGGVRMSAATKQKFSSEIFDDSKEKIKNSFFTNQFRYGLMGQIGWGSFKVTAKYDLNSFFQEDRGPDYQIAQVTFGWTM